MNKIMLIAGLLAITIIPSTGVSRTRQVKSRASGSPTYCASYVYTEAAPSTVSSNQKPTSSGYRHQGSDPRLPMLYKGL